MKTYNLNIEGEQFAVTVESVSGNTATVSVNGRPFNVNIEENKDSAEAPVMTKPKPAGIPAASVASPVSSVKEINSSASISAVKSPLPGVILDIKVSIGDKVREGQVIAVLEAMKMENDIEAEREGTIKSINVAKGESVLEGAIIVTID